MHTLKFAAAFATLCCTLMADPTTQPSTHTTPSGLKYTEINPAEAWAAKTGDTVYVQYTGTLADGGTKFDSSYDHPDKQPISFTLGAGQVIKGWDEGIVGMKLGDKRTLTIPSNLAYGEAGAGGGKIPANATLKFDVELVGLVRK